MNPTFPSYDLSAELREAKRHKSLRRIAQSALPLRDYAHQADKLQRRIGEAARKAYFFTELNVELALANAKRIAGYILIWVAAVAVYFIDFVLLGAVAEYFARRVYSDPIMVTVARTVIPASILTVEMMIASQRSFAREQAFEYGRSRTQWVWALFSLLIICVLPSMVVATHYASVPTTLTPTLESILRFQLIGLVALSVVMHGVVLHGGQLAVEAKGFLFFRLKMWRFNRKVNVWQGKFDSAAAAATNAYIDHVRLVEEHNGQFPGQRVTPGPFDKVTQELLAATLGSDQEDVLRMSTETLRAAYQNDSGSVTEFPGRDQAYQA